MKKTTIIAIFLVYLASILIVNFFGLQVMQMQGNQYVSEIIVNGVELTNRTDAQDKTVKILENPNEEDTTLVFYAFYFIVAEEGAEYTAEAESLATNPNRVKINYKVNPYDAGNSKLRFDYQNEKVVFDAETEELVFLKKAVITLVLRATDGSQVNTTIKLAAG